MLNKIAKFLGYDPQKKELEDLAEMAKAITALESSLEKLSEDHKKRFDPKGFWRVDKDKHPEHRLTVLSYVAFCDLQDKIKECGGDREKGIEAFCNQNDGQGWMLPVKASVRRAEDLAEGDSVTVTLEF